MNSRSILLMEWNRVIHGNCLDLLPNLPDASVELVLTDPPFNIGLEYDLYKDRKGYEEYQIWCNKWLLECNRILKPHGSIYVWIGDEYVSEINILMKKMGLFWRNTLVWYYTFGENQKKKFNRCKTNCLYFTKSKDDFIWNADLIKVPSARQLKYKDKRAKEGGKLPDDVWESTEHIDTSPSALPDDVWKMSRLCGTFTERIRKPDGSAHPCQMPQSVISRCVLASSNEGHVVVDPFCGTGTTAAVAKMLKRQYWTCDLSQDYVEVAKERLGMMDSPIYDAPDDICQALV